VKILPSFLLLAALPAFGSYMYDFSYTPTTGPVQSVSFEIDSAGIPLNGAFSFTPFNVVEGSNTESITQGYADVIDLSGTDYMCFAFGTANAFLGPGCSAGVNNPPLSLFLGFNFFPLPASSMNVPGTYNTSSDQFLDWGGTDPAFPNGVFGRGNMSLTITATPEPSSRTIVFAGLVSLLALATAKRTRACAVSRRV
jgi:hypothetical protein